MRGRHPAHVICEHAHAPTADEYAHAVAYPPPVHVQSASSKHESVALWQW
jgi:hypothetical protein